MRWLILVFMLFGNSCGLRMDDFIPFGEDNGDSIFPANDDNVRSLTAPSRLPFSDRSYSSIHISNNGLLSFESVLVDYTPQDFPLAAPRGMDQRPALIAPFWADVDTRAGSGKVYFRSTDNQTVLDMIKTTTDKVLLQRQSCLLANKFTPKWALVATWSDVGYYELHHNKLNTFQVVVTTDGLFSFAIFNYAKIEWVTGDASQGSDGFGGTPAMVGVNVGDGVRSIKYEHTLTDEVVQVVNATNIGVPGQLVYWIDDSDFITEDDAVSGSGDMDVHSMTDNIGALCHEGDLCISPSHGTIQSGGILTVTGPPLILQPKDHRIRMRFEGINEVLYTLCRVTAVPVNSAVLCPVPLFSPNSAGVKNVTLLIGNCKTGYAGKYRVEEPTIFIDGSLQVHKMDCLEPFGLPVLTTNDVLCLTWDPKRQFGTDDIPGISIAHIGVFVHFTGPGVLYEEATASNTSGWGTVNLVEQSLVNGVFFAIDGWVQLSLRLRPANPRDYSNPPPSLIFIRVTAVVNWMEVFTSTPLMSYIPTNQSASPGEDCRNISHSTLLVNSLPPCPRNTNQAFADTNLEVDFGCVEGSKAPFNCYTNPGASVCFRPSQSGGYASIHTVRCCYNSSGSLEVRRPGGGLLLHPIKEGGYFDRFSKDVWPFLVCCKDPKTPDETCHGFLQRLPSPTSENYLAPIVGTTFSSSLVKSSEVFLRLNSNRFTAPLMLTYDSAVELNRTSHLCYEVFITPNTTVNLFSSSNLVINAHYMLLSGQYYISDIGIVVGGASAPCTNVKIHGEKCMAFINGENISTHNNTGQHAYVRSVGSSHMPTVWRVTSSKGYSIADVRCTRRSNGFLDVEALDLLIPMSLQDQNAHGLLGQFWQARTSVTRPDCEDYTLFSHVPLYTVQIWEASSNTTNVPGLLQAEPDYSFPATLYPASYDIAGPGPCLYTSYKGPSVIAGTASDYTVSDLLATRYQYTKFTATC